MALKVKDMELISLVLMLIPFVSLIGLILYIFKTDATKGNTIKLVVALLSIPFGFLASVFLWLDAFSVIDL